MAFDRITVDPQRMNGKPCIRSTRLTVHRVLQALATYPDRAELRREYPELEEEDIRQALGFAATMLDDSVLEVKPASCGARSCSAARAHPDAFARDHGQSSCKRVLVHARNRLDQDARRLNDGESKQTGDDDATASPGVVARGSREVRVHREQDALVSDRPRENALVGLTQEVRFLGGHDFMSKAFQRFRHRGEHALVREELHATTPASSSARRAA